MEQKTTLVQAVKEYKSGNADAFCTLYEESNKYVYTCIYKVMAGNDNAQDIIDDIMQDTYVEISRSLAQLESEERFLQWAGMIATRKCYAYIKKNKKYVLLKEEDSTFDTLADSDDIIPESVIQDREKQRLVRKIIETELTEMQKLCIIAYFYNEQKQSEIAEELGIPENTVKTNISRAKAKIKEGVLDLEKKEGTKLYSVAPFLLLLFKEDVQAAVVPKAISQSVMSSVSLAAGAGATTTGTISSASAVTGSNVGKGIMGKIAAASVKTKIMGSIIAVGLTGAAGGTVYVATQDKQEIQVQQEVAGSVVEATTETKESSSSKKKKEKERYYDKGIWMKDTTVEVPEGLETTLFPNAFEYGYGYGDQGPLQVTEAISVYNSCEIEIGYLKPDVEFMPCAYNEDWVCIRTEKIDLFVKTEEYIAAKKEDCPLLEVEKEEIPEAIPDENDPNIMLFTEDKSCHIIGVGDCLIYDNYVNGNVIQTIPFREKTGTICAYFGYTVNTDTEYAIIEYKGSRGYVTKDQIIRINMSIDEIEQ